MLLVPCRRWATAIAACLVFEIALFGQTPQAPRSVSIEPAVSAMPLPADRGADSLWQSLQKLHTRASLIMVTAHPDDEDGGMLTRFSRNDGGRAVLLTLNRGEGGQNVMSNDYYDALGLVRTEELLAAGRYYGVQQYFTRVVDYGFSKGREEALQMWGKDRTLYDVVRVVRMTRPLVVTSVFVGAPTDGHGNHEVAGEMAQLVFKAAGDPNVFPDQIKAGLRPWKPLKMYARVPFFSIQNGQMYDYATGKSEPARFYDFVNDKWIDGQPGTNVEIQEGQYSPVLGLSFIQFSREGLGEQKSQNGGTGVPAAGPVTVPYHRYGSLVNTTGKEQSFFDGIDTSLAGIATLAKGDSGFLKQGLRQVNSAVEQAMAQYSAQDPGKIAPTLAQGAKALNALVQQVEASSLDDESKYDVLHELHIKQAQFNTALEEALGISLDAAVAPEQEPSGRFAFFGGPQETFQIAIPGQKFFVRVHVVNQSAAPLNLAKVSLDSPEGESWPSEMQKEPPSTLAPGAAVDVRFQVTVPENARITKPYFSRPDVEQPFYNIDDPRYVNRPLPPYPLSGWAEFEYDGVPIRVGEVVQTTQRVTGPGVVMNPLAVAPAIGISISPSGGIVPLNATSFAVSATIHSNVKGAAKGMVRLKLPEGWRSEPAQADFATAKDGQDQTVGFRVFPSNLQPKPYTVTAEADYDGKQYTEGYTVTGYQGLRPYYLYRNATYDTRGVDVKVAPGLNVGYVMGTGDDVPGALAQMGVPVHFLTPQDIASGDLSRYDAIVLGVRTYAVRDELRIHNGRLLDYVKNGGVVIVQYQTPQYDHNYGPYPYTLTNDPEKVVQEHGEVSIVDPNNPVLTWPNKITTADFQDWVEERGHDFMKSWAPEWQTPIEMHDEGQDPQKGGLLYARYGKGVYVYTSFALYRQLPESVPGAYRLFANLLSLPKNPAVQQGK